MVQLGGDGLGEREREGGGRGGIPNKNNMQTSKHCGKKRSGCGCKDEKRNLKTVIIMINSINKNLQF